MTPQQAFDECYNNNNKRDKDLEPIIIKDSCYAYLYAKDVIKGRWKEAEDIIATDSGYTYWYARNVINGKLPENMHNAILLHADTWAKKYFEFIKNNS